MSDERKAPPGTTEIGPGVYVVNESTSIFAPQQAKATDDATTCLSWFVTWLESEDTDNPILRAFEDGRLGTWDNYELDWPEVVARLRSGEPVLSGPAKGDEELVGMYRRAYALVDGFEVNPATTEALEAAKVAAAEAEGQARYWENEHERVSEELHQADERIKELEADNARVDDLESERAELDGKVRRYKTELDALAADVERLRGALYKVLGKLGPAVQAANELPAGLRADITYACSVAGDALSATSRTEEDDG